MKKLFSALLIVCFSVASVVAQKDAKVASYGASITPDKAVDVKKLPEMMKGHDTLNVKVTGTVREVCQKKGCWMKMDMGNGETMMVHFKDYGFFVPKDCSGKRLVMEGMAFIDETSVDQLRHYAEDAGKSKEEIAKITEPERELTFEATGVLIYEK